MLQKGIENYHIILNSYAQYQLDTESGKVPRNNAEDTERYRELLVAANEAKFDDMTVKADILKVKEYLKNGKKPVWNTD